VSPTARDIEVAVAERVDEPISSSSLAEMGYKHAMSHLVLDFYGFPVEEHHEIITDTGLLGWSPLEN
jgi:hypothetical protein